MAKLTDFSGRPVSGTVPFAVVGLVTSNEDPDQLGRIQVKFPTLHEEPVSFWLRQVSPNAGPDRGFYALPEVDDEVLVLFMQGSQDVGVIIGQFWNGVDTPPAEAGDGAGGSVHASNMGKDASAGSGGLPPDNDRRFWKSRSGHLFIFDDKDGSETVEIWDKSRSLSLVFDTAGETIQLSSAKGNVEISAGKDVTITAGQHFQWYAAQNVKGEAGMDIEVKAGMNYAFEAGMDAKMKAGMNFKIEGGMTFDAKGGMTAKMKGGMSATVEGGMMGTFKGGVMAELKGGIVMIN